MTEAIVSVVINSPIGGRQIEAGGTAKLVTGSGRAFTTREFSDEESSCARLAAAAETEGIEWARKS
jgi:hypothetical protein